VSSIAYGALTRRRQQATKENNLTDAGGIGVYVDALAALVPVEVLAAHALILSFTTTKASVPAADGATLHGAVVSEPSALKLTFFALIVLSVVFYAIGLRPGKISWKVVLGGAVPAFAFVAWTMIQRTTAFDAVAPGMNFASRQVIGVLAAMLLPVLAGVLAVKLNNSDPEPAIGAGEPTGSSAGPAGRAAGNGSVAESAMDTADSLATAQHNTGGATHPVGSLNPDHNAGESHTVAHEGAPDTAGPVTSRVRTGDEDPDSTQIIPPD
jgi:hypothetical protein